ncbi:MAG: helix-turn-helix domain-containing protein [Alphaproteobacteria bacterium]|nr:helix-turn-helix domain-containing protein [Alphaproteobacteria bacterium]MDE6571085.1 helix-turn-helix domain-containing protein [Alphaproteobacteria bacterium]
MAGKTTLVTDYDKRLGRLLTMHRTRQGLSQKALARAVGCSFQQIQKYECAGNRMSVSRLHQICKYLEIPMGQFLQESDANYTQDAKRMRIMRNLDKMDPRHINAVILITDALAANRMP